MVTTPGRAAVDIAADISVESGVIALDHVLSHETSSVPLGLVERRQQIADIIDTDARLSRSHRLRTAFDTATGLAESAGESLCLVALRTLGFNGIQQQVDIADAEGGFVARVDFLLDDGRTIIEVDGAVKYIDAARGGFARGDELLQEKRRQYSLERLGYRVIRVMWRDLLDPARFRRLLEAAGVMC